MNSRSLISHRDPKHRKRQKKLCKLIGLARVPKRSATIFIWEAGWEEPFGNNSNFICFRNLEVLHGHSFVTAYIHEDNA